MKKVLMVCLGNICRSPMAEGILRQKANLAEKSLEIDSCGTSAYHTGEHPDKRAVATLSKKGIDISTLQARQFEPVDFERFDYILAMDQSNFENIRKLATSENDVSKLKLMLNYHPSSKIHSVPDPYFGGQSGFEEVFELLDTACDSFLQSLQ